MIGNVRSLDFVSLDFGDLGELLPMNVLRLFLWLAALASAAAGQDQCPLLVRVMNPAGNLLSGVPVTVEEKDGRAESGVTNNGQVRFCDLGVLHVTVGIGSQYGCSYTKVQNVPLAWGITRTLSVIFDDMACRVDEPPPILLCAVLFRFKDDAGKWIPGVTFKPSLQRLPNAESDSYGRIMVRMANGEDLKVEAVKQGYLSEPINLHCSRNLLLREQTVTMHGVR
jgi:hypothetical protein